MQRLQAKQLRAFEGGADAGNFLKGLGSVIDALGAFLHGFAHGVSGTTHSDDKNNPTGSTTDSKTGTRG